MGQKQQSFYSLPVNFFFVQSSFVCIFLFCRFFMFVFDLSDTSYHFNNPTTTNITLCLLSIFQVSVVAAATTTNNIAVVVVSLVYFAFLFFLSTAYFYKNYSVQITLCYYIFVITHFFKKVLQRSLFFFAAMQQQITKKLSCLSKLLLTQDQGMRICRNLCFLECIEIK